MLLKNLSDSGAIQSVEKHSKQGLFTPIAVPEKAAPTVTTAATDAKKTKGAEKKKWFILFHIIFLILLISYYIDYLFPHKIGGNK